MQENDLEYCRDAIKTGSFSFHAASRLLPSAVRDPALALYTFCRVADDCVDLVTDKHGAVENLCDRLDRVYQGQPKDHPADRALAHIVAEFEIPKVLLDALLEGFAWDAEQKRYETLSDIRSYSARVASTVGVMMAILMGARSKEALARAADLGVAMQLTNIARDVGEDAREGRLYLPLEWFEEASLDPEAFMANPKPSLEIRHMVRRILAEAHRLYVRSEAGIAVLPIGSRFGIFAARHIYSGIGKAIRANKLNSITHRCHTTKTAKALLVFRAAQQTLTSLAFPVPTVLQAPALHEVAFLVEAAERSPRRRDIRFERNERIFATLMDLQNSGRRT